MLERLKYSALGNFWFVWIEPAFKWETWQYAYSEFKRTERGG